MDNYASFSLFELVWHRDNLKISNIREPFQVTRQIMNILPLFPSLLVVFVFLYIPDVCWRPGGKTNKHLKSAALLGL